MKVNLKRSELDEMIQQIILESIQEENNEGIGSFMKGFFGGKQGQQDKERVSNKFNTTKNKAQNVGNKIKNVQAKAINKIANGANKTVDAMSNGAEKIGRDVTNRYNDGRNAFLADKIEKKWKQMRQLLIKANHENPTRTFKSQLSGVDRGIKALIDGLRSGEEGYGYKE